MASIGERLPIRLNQIWSLDHQGTEYCLVENDPLDLKKTTIWGSESKSNDDIFEKRWNKNSWKPASFSPKTSLESPERRSWRNNSNSNSNSNKWVHKAAKPDNNAVKNGGHRSDNNNDDRDEINERCRVILSYQLPLSLSRHLREWFTQNKLPPLLQATYLLVDLSEHFGPEVVNLFICYSEKYRKTLHPVQIELNQKTWYLVGQAVYLNFNQSAVVDTVTDPPRLIIQSKAKRGMNIPNASSSSFKEGYDFNNISSHVDLQPLEQRFNDDHELLYQPTVNGRSGKVNYLDLLQIFAVDS